MERWSAFIMVFCPKLSETVSVDQVENTGATSGKIMVGGLWQTLRSEAPDRGSGSGQKERLSVPELRENGSWPFTVKNF